VIRAGFLFVLVLLAVRGFTSTGHAARPFNRPLTLGVPDPDRHGCSRRLGAVLGSPSENVDNAYLAARSGELVIARIGFEVPDGLGEPS
jgi:hypothetical protein